ncbi:hypothetical protein [Microbacterium telephonicum]|nr:hypothetical protein [Microbacterium telephonicum]
MTEQTAAALGDALRPVAVRRGLWRVVDAAGRIVGHLEARDDETGCRFIARRFHAASGRLRTIGEFWSAREAAECLRWSR